MTHFSPYDHDRCFTVFAITKGDADKEQVMGDIRQEDGKWIFEPVIDRYYDSVILLEIVLKIAELEKGELQ